MSPYTSENAAEFEAPGWGKKVKVLFGHKRHFHWDSYIKSRPEQIKSSELPNMLEYWGLTKSTTVFVSSDHMIKIECSMPKVVLYPSCTVMRPYKYKTETGATIHPEFFITYHFSRDYIQQWHGIDKKVEVLIDQFAASAQNWYQIRHKWGRGINGVGVDFQNIFYGKTINDPAPKKMGTEPDFGAVVLWANIELEVKGMPRKARIRHAGVPQHVIQAEKMGTEPDFDARKKAASEGMLNH